MRGKRSLRLGLVFVVCAAAGAAAQVRYSVNGPMVLRNGAGSEIFTVTNVGTAAVPLALRLGAFSDEATQTPAGDPKVALAWDTGAPMPESIWAGSDAADRGQCERDERSERGERSAVEWGGPAGTVAGGGDGCAARCFDQRRRRDGPGVDAEPRRRLGGAAEE